MLDSGASTVTYGRAADVRISELMYNAPQGRDYEYIELVNDGAEPVDLTGWQLLEAVTFVFGEGVVLEPGARIVVVEEEEPFRRAWPAKTGRWRTKDDRVGAIRSMPACPARRTAPRTVRSSRT